MVGKRKANQMREMFAKMAKESEEEKSRGDKYEERRKEYFKLNLQHLSKKKLTKTVANSFCSKSEGKSLFLVNLDGPDT